MSLLGVSLVRSVADAWRVSNKMPSQNVVSWNAILRGRAKHGAMVMKI
jgi:hypothetical protein